MYADTDMICYLMGRSSQWHLLFVAGLDSLFPVTANSVTHDTHTSERLRPLNLCQLKWKQLVSNFCPTKQQGLILSCTPCSIAQLHMKPKACHSGQMLTTGSHNERMNPKHGASSLAKGIERSFMLAHPNMILPRHCPAHKLKMVPTTLLQRVASLGSRAYKSFRSRSEVCIAWQCWCETNLPSYAQQPLPLGHRPLADLLM